MKKLLISCCAAILMLCSVSARAQELTKAEKDKALAYLESTKAGVLASVKGLSSAQLNFKPAPDRWSVAECLEHIASAEDFLRAIDTNQVMKAPAVPNRDVKAIDEGILKGVPDRGVKRQAPEPLKPSNKYGSPEASQKHFVESRAITEAFLKDTPDLRQHAMAFFSDTPMDAYEFILVIAAHSERHTKQIEEVKADPNFPKS
jgi:DinB superfamily